MSILKIITNTPKTMLEMYDYMIDQNKTSADTIFGIWCNPFTAIEEMQFVKNIYHSNYLHPYTQIIFIFDIGVNYDLYIIKSICKQIGYILITDKRQVFGAIHYKGNEQTGIHCHYMVNSVGIYGNHYKIMHYLRYYELVNKILISYNLNPIKMF